MLTSNRALLLQQSYNCLHPEITHPVFEREYEDSAGDETEKY